MDSNGVITSASGAIKELAKVINACILDEKNRAAIMSHLAESQKYLDNAIVTLGYSWVKSGRGLVDAWAQSERAKELQRIKLMKESMEK